MIDGSKITAHHWGLGSAEVKNGRLTHVGPHPGDPDPSPINGNIASSLNGSARVLRPAVRKGWLEGTDMPRGQDTFVEMSWDAVNDLIVRELIRVRETHGNEAIFGGSYGWGSAGRFHHPQGQLKRFLNTIGGFVGSEGNYSYMAAQVLMPHILAPFPWCLEHATRFSVIRENTDLMVMFGGIPARNMQVSDGGIVAHNGMVGLKDCAKAGTHFMNVSPLRRDADAALNAEWIAPRPGTDVALMMGIAHVLLTEGLCDRDFLARYTVGFDRFEPYLSGLADGVAKTPAWAAHITGLAATDIIELARRMARQRTMISVAVALQRADYGEQPLWMAVTLAAMLGQIGLPGGGVTIGYGMNGCIGQSYRPFRWASLPQGRNPVQRSIPVAMIADMLLHPGEPYRFNGESRTFPDIRLVWWTGGNPFHHHQDLFRLHEAFQKPETIIVNEINWTATTRRADIVLPVTAPTERKDFAAGRADLGLAHMPPLVAPPGEAKTEYAIFTELAARLGAEAVFTDGQSAESWLRTLWEETRDYAKTADLTLPEWETFVRQGTAHVPDGHPDHVFLKAFRDNPVAHPLPTPSGKIEIFSPTIAGFGLSDCPGHPTWFPPRDRGDDESLFLISGQPEARLHSQMDNGAYSLSQKIHDREPVLIHPDDAAERGIEDRSVVELWNDRGTCVAGALLTEDIAPGCLFLRTGAWFDPDFSIRLCRHGNPNALTHDARTSSLAQGPASHSAQVWIRPHRGDVPKIQVFSSPLEDGHA